VLSPSFRFSHAFESSIWKVVLDEENASLVLELRDEESQQISYARFDLNSNHSEQFEIEESDLWTTLRFYKKPYIFLEQFSDPQNPNSKSLILYNTVAGYVEKSFTDFQFEKVINGSLIGRNLKEGGVLETFTLQIQSSTNKNHIISPAYFPAKSEPAETVAQYLEVENSGVGFEYYEDNIHIIICYYERLGTNFDRTLVVISNGEEVLKRKLDKEILGYAAGGFFVYADLLIFIENRNQLHAFEL